MLKPKTSLQTRFQPKKKRGQKPPAKLELALPVNLKRGPVWENLTGAKSLVSVDDFLKIGTLHAGG